jgi:hypothetical protein
MLCAVAEDLRQAAGVEPVTIQGNRQTRDIAIACRRIEPRQEEAVFRELAAGAEWTLVIAPEFQRLLETRCRWVLEAGGRLLGPDLPAVGLTADKFALAAHLTTRQVPTPRTAVCDDPKALRFIRFPAVLKPRTGAGSQATFLVPDPGGLPSALEQARAEVEDEMLLQEFVPGTAASVAFLVGPRQTITLPAARQHLSSDRRFRYHGGSLPLPEVLARRARQLARRAVDAVEGLGGYVGVDLVLGEAEDGSGDRVIEINPRLTTSYVGLRALAESNLAEAMLRVAAGKEVEELRWRPGSVRFSPGGEVVRGP